MDCVTCDKCRLWGKIQVGRSSIMALSTIYFKLAEIVKGNQAKTPNMGKIQAKSDQFSITVVGYKWSREVVIFCKVTEKGSTIKLALLEFRFRPQVFSK